MLRFTRPLFNQVVKSSTGITGLRVHHDPLPELKQTYESTLAKLSTIPETSVYRQGVEALTRHRLNVVQSANDNVAEVEKQLDEGQIEEVLDVAKDELSLVENMIQWKAWEPLEEKPEPGQWQYFGKAATASS
ncbi:NADH2 dehydrogenase [Obba rivulosa]|uniref:NADH2 dehydrogenase n=1 Tax=Obba rivulosa TaxID=1052685 RepID=A0A8E2DV60_9APHY|nr:NADH2 dehydrogenase [Obba rivulosa]